jgi:hypothetical protein
MDGDCETAVSDSLIVFFVQLLLVFLTILFRFGEGG